VIRTQDLCFAVGNFSLQPTSLELADGEYFVLLGPPGSGKSVFLECLCGLNQLDGGRILIDGRDVTDLEPRQRGIGYVPQDYALFPHLSVRSNIAFGLSWHGLADAEARETAEDTAALLNIQHLLDRRVNGLSGGEKQRTALARALAIRPRLLLLDEPVSALDEATRESVCAELRRVQHQLGITTIHVSHNLEEAFSVADRGGIFRDGRFQQVGSMGELLRRPASEFVARFMRCENILTGSATGTSGEFTVLSVAGAEFLAPGDPRQEVRFVIRPENVCLHRPGFPIPEPCARLELKLVRHVDRGAYVRAHLSGAVDLVAHLSHSAFRELGVSEDDEVLVAVRADAVHVLPESGEQLSS
jgi:ABC-type sugar transport system ATPase subunit